MALHIRLAEPADAAALLAIYAPYVTDTTVSFELEPPSEAEFAARIAATRERFCYLVAEDGRGEVAGYAYYGSFRARPAYTWAAETSIYLAPAAQRRGLGSVLLDALERLMRAQGVRMAEACITSDNAGSIAFHERHGYRACGEHHACGFKLGRWLDVTWMEKDLRPELGAAGKPGPLRTLAPEEIEPVLAAANARL